MTTATTAERAQGTVRLDYERLVDFTTEVFTRRGLPPQRAAIAARALVHGDLTGVTSHGLANLTRLYLPLFDDERADPRAELEIVSDRGAALLVDSHRALGLWSAHAAMDLALERAATHGVALVSLYNGTHFGCAGHFTAHAAEQGAIGFLAGNCGGQRIIRPPGAAEPLLGTNPFSIAVPVGAHPAYVLDMSTTVVPTGRIRAAARAGREIPEGWLADDAGRPVTDPHAFDRGEAHLQWLGGRPQTGSFKGYALSLMVETLAALLPGAELGPVSTAGRDDNIGFFTLAIAPGRLRAQADFLKESEELFDALLNARAVDPAQPVRYPGWPEAQHADEARAHGVPLTADLFAELEEVARDLSLTAPTPLGGTR
ncbi:Ldh family oxidoreductase [Streptomyces beihaiensis]|uniref:Ldh family oxidoreductase n=1 Tax=Streptomyces beihaiensis TaxID=2984495 RepID=A0ABT3TR09_9ACTN|nr:Ldh family oxidoreductase [Streptomyces beihaiensis]MCX3059478.1 Ldh family oxidoreductase [Streptomyces beihaiensis]